MAVPYWPKVGEAVKYVFPDKDGNPVTVSALVVRTFNPCEGEPAVDLVWIDEMTKFRDGEGDPVPTKVSGLSYGLRKIFDPAGNLVPQEIPYWIKY